jgi:rhamnulokinase
MPQKPEHYLAIDLGASNIRLVHGILDDFRFDTEVVFRFSHGPVQVGNHLKWDWAYIIKGIREGLLQAAEQIIEPIKSISCSSWAQDFGLLNESGDLLYPPMSYRDARTTGLPHAFSHLVSPQELLKNNGSVISPITSLCQLYALSRSEPQLLQSANRLLFIADLVHFVLCGELRTDWTAATVSQMLNIRTEKWDIPLLNRLGINGMTLPDVEFQSAKLAALRPEFRKCKSLENTIVTLSSNHDTAAATVLLGKHLDDSLFLNLGTWAMLGTAGLPHVIKNDGSVLMGLPFKQWGTFYSLTGLWLLQQYKKILDPSDLITYDQLVSEAEKSSIDCTIDSDSPDLVAPVDMCKAIQDICMRSGVNVPRSPGDFVNVILNSISIKVALKIKELETRLDKKFEAVFVVGGGSRNIPLLKKIAAQIHCSVFAGPSEATVLGNLILQSFVHNEAKFPNFRHEILCRSVSWNKI